LLLLAPVPVCGETNPTDEPLAVPLSIAVNYAHEWVSGTADPGVQVTINLTDDIGALKDQATVTVNGSGNFLTQWGDWTSGAPDIQPYDYVYASVPGDTTNVGPVGMLSGRADADDDTVYATLHAPWFTGPLDVRCEIWEASGPPGIDLTAATDGGSFECDFGAAGWDLLRPQQVAIQYREPDGDRVINVLDWPWMRVNYARDRVGMNYPEGHAITITVTESDGVTIKAIGNAESTAEGGWDGAGFNAIEWSAAPPDILPGDKVSFDADDGFSDFVSVGEIKGSLNVDTDTVSGTILAPAVTQRMKVECHPWGAWPTNPEAPIKHDWAEPDESEAFSCLWDPQSEWDILPGQDVAVMYIEPDLDRVIDVYREPQAHLRISQWVRGDAAEGGNLVFRIHIRNDGDAAENVVVTATAGGLAYLTDTSGFPHSGTGNGPIAWDLGTLDPEARVEFNLYFEVTASSGQALSNFIEITTSSSDGGDPSEKVALWEGVAEANDTQLSVSKRAWTSDPVPGYDFVYAIEICNQGATGSSELTLTDTLSERQSLVGWWASETGWAEDSLAADELVVTLPSLPGFACTEVYARAHVGATAQPGESLINTATIVADNNLNTEDNVATLDLTVGELHINVHVIKSLGPSAPVPGGLLRYWIDFTNTGNVPVDSVFQVIDTLPADTTFLGAWLHSDGEQIPFPPSDLSPASATWEIPGLDNGFSHRIELILSLSPDLTLPAWVTNIVEIEGVAGDENPADNVFESVTFLQEAGPNLQVSKTSTLVSGGIDYEIRFANPGDVPIEAVTLTDTLPAFVTLDGGWWRDETFDWDRLTGFEQVGGQLIWTFNELWPGDAGAIYFHVDLDEPDESRSYTNTVEITLHPEDTEPADNVAIDIIDVIGSYTVGGTVGGLTGTGLVLQNNGGDNLPIGADGGFTFATPLPDGSEYIVTVLTHPSDPEQTCSVSNDSGTLAGANITNVAVTCTTETFTVGGTVNGLAGTGLVLQNNGGDNLLIGADGDFTFSTPLADGSGYAVSVLNQPNAPSQTCTVANASGILAGANVTNVTVTCSTATFTVGGTVNGLAGTGLVLQNNGGDNLPIGADGGFTFSTPLADGSGYAVTVLTQPSAPIQTCSVSNGNGTLAGADISDVVVTCTTTCNVNIVTAMMEFGDVLHEACEILVIGEGFVAGDGASVSLSSGWEIWFTPDFSIEKGATLDAKVCGQSLCLISESPMPYGCHSCVNQICDIDPTCCDLEFDEACLDQVNTVCGLVCE
jgi:uncharacterized repeat protein (TIGR01451 family)